MTNTSATVDDHQAPNGSARQFRGADSGERNVSKGIGLRWHRPGPAWSEPAKELAGGSVGVEPCGDAAKVIEELLDRWTASSSLGA